MSKDMSQIKHKLDIICEQGNKLYDSSKYDDAIKTWLEGLAIINNDENFYNATIWFLASIGDAYFMKKDYKNAYIYFQKAIDILEKDEYENPFITFRLGECLFETGDYKKSAIYLKRAYDTEGEDIFMPDEQGEDDGQKYLQFLKEFLNLNNI